MTRVLALKLQSNSALAVVVNGSSDQPIAVEAVVSIPLAAELDAAARGKAIAAALHDFKPSRTPAVVCVPRSDLSLLTMDLPPSPPEDLPDLVHLQAQRDLPLSEDGEGFDFLPLEGGEEQPYKVMAAGLLPNLWKTLCELCDAADLKLARVVPEPLGWHELGRRLVTGEPEPGLLRVFSSIIQRQAVVWAAEGEQLRLIRSVWLPEDENAVADAAALGGELRRTQLALTQSHPEHRGAAKCIYLGVNADEIAGELSATLSKPVQAAFLEQAFEIPAAIEYTAPLVEIAPMAALASAVARKQPAPIDLLHPRRRPAPPNRSRTYILAGVAAALLIALVGWTGYRNLQEPLEAAALARAQQEALEPTLQSLAVDEAKAQAVRAWLAGATNLLTELDDLSRQLRPEPLDSEQFPADSDLVLQKLTLTNRQLTLDAVAKNTGAIPAAEQRLRSAHYAVDRGPVQSGSEVVAGYPVSVTGMVQRREEAAATEGGAP